MRKGLTLRFALFSSKIRKSSHKKIRTRESKPPLSFFVGWGLIVGIHRKIHPRTESPLYLFLGRLSVRRALVIYTSGGAFACQNNRTPAQSNKERTKRKRTKWTPRERRTRWPAFVRLSSSAVSIFYPVSACLCFLMGGGFWLSKPERSPRK